jgi:integrase
MPLTVKQIESARYGLEKERLGDGAGLYLRLFQNGAKRFQVQVAKEPRSKARGWVTLGDYPDLSLKAARGVAARVRAMADEGMAIPEIRQALALDENATNSALESDGRVAPRKRSQSKQPLPEPSDPLLLRNAAAAWFENKRGTLSNGKHIDQNWNTIATYVLPELGDRLVTEIRRKDVVDTLRPIWHTKNTTASRTLARLKEIIELARLTHDLEIVNPAEFCKKTAFGYTSRRTKHHAALPVERVPELWQWLEEVTCDETTRQAAQLLLLTAKRTNEVRFAAWPLIDMDAGIWTTEAGLMKSRLMHRVPLSSQAKILLQNAALLAPDAKLVFARPKTKSGSFSENTILQLVKRFEPHLTGHGFRANFKTWARVQKRYDRDAIEFALAHVQDSLEEAYMRDDLLKERAELMQDWADYVTSGTAPAALCEKLGLR